MTGYTDTFGGSTVQPSNVSYAAVALSASINTYWPPYVTGTQQPLARLMDVTASTTGLVIKLPDATLAGTGQDVFFNNLGSNTYTVQDANGSVVATIAAGQQKYLYLSDNSTVGGTWRVTLFGVGSSSPDASQLAGSGLKVIGATLNQSSPTSTIAANTTFTSSDRAKVYVNIGGSITCTLPSTSTSTVSNDFFFEFRNQGTGTVTLTAVGGETIDGSTTIVLQVNESCIVHSGTGAWYTVGRGRNTSFNFTQLLKTVTGGTTTLSLTEASNVVQTYSGTATSNNTIVVPAVVQVYYISNQVLGGYTFTIQSPTPGSTLVLPYGQNAVVFCDGINVINASTSVSGISALLLAAGSVSSPSMAIAALNNGLYAPTSTTIAVSAGGVNAGTFSSNGYNGRIGGDTPAAGAFTTLSSTGGAINGTVGATTPSTGAFTTLSASGDYSSSGSPVIYSYNGGTAGTVRAGVQLIGTTPEVRTFISGTGVTSVTSTGLSVTGALSATVTSTSSPSLALNYNSSTNYLKFSMNANGDGVIAVPAVNGSSSGQARINAAGNVIFSADSGTTPHATVSTTGLVVTGETRSTKNGATFVGVTSGTLSTTGISYVSFQDSAERGWVGYGSGDSSFGISNTVGTIRLGSSNGSAVLGGGTFAVTGALSSTDTISTSKTGANALLFNANSATTTAQRFNIQSTGATFQFGTESSAGGSFFSGSSAYASVLGTQNATPLQFGTNGAIGATLDTAGNWGLGVVPSAWSSTYKAIQMGSSGAFIFDGNFGTTSVATNAYWNASSVATYKLTGYASAYSQIGNTGAHAWYTAPSGTAGNAITWTQAMTLDASGNLLVGQTSYAAVNANAVAIGAGATAGSITVQHISGTATGARYSAFNYNATEIGSITQSGTTAVLYNTTSDQRLKENIKDADSANPLIDQIQVRQYDWKSDGSHQRYGFIAQELVQVFPEAVHQPSDPDDMMAVDYSKLVPLLLKEVQELRARLNIAGIQ